MFNNILFINDLSDRRHFLAAEKSGYLNFKSGNYGTAAIQFQPPCEWNSEAF